MWHKEETLTLKKIIQFPQAPGIYHKTYGHIRKIYVIKHKTQAIMQNIFKATVSNQMLYNN